MATEQDNPLSYPADVDLSASQFCGVAMNSDGELVLPSAGGAILGILYTKPAAAGRAGTVWGPGSGQKRCKLGGTVVPGDRLKVDSSGRFLLASAGDILAGAAVAVCAIGGAVNEIGACVLFGGAGAVTQSSASESIATSVDASVYVGETLITIVTADHTGVLADGLFVGQKKTMRVISQTGSFSHTVTPTTMQAGQPLAFVFTAKGQMIELTWSATGWVVTNIKTAGTGTTAAAGTINPLIRRQGLTIGSAGPEDRILPSGYVPGHTIKIAADTVGSGTTTISGLFNDEDGSADGIDANYNAALDECTFVWDGARWDPSSNISVTIST